MGPHTNEVARILDSIRRVVQVVRAGSSELERKLGLTGAQAFVLQKLASEDGSSVNELAARTFTHQSSVSVVVRKLEEKGLLRRAPGRADRRRVELWLTARGKRLLEKVGARGTPADRLIGGILRMPAGRRSTLASAMEELTVAMGVGDGVAGMFMETAGPGARTSRG